MRPREDIAMKPSTYATYESKREGIEAKPKMLVSFKKMLDRQRPISSGKTLNTSHHSKETSVNYDNVLRAVDYLGKHANNVASPLINK